MANRRKYLNYTTPWGVDLARVATAGWTPFLIHESGYQAALEDWNHQGVDSPFWRFYHNPKPGCFLRFKGQTIPLGPENAVLIPADTVFDCCGPVKACHFWLHFTTTRPGVSFSAAPIVMPMDSVLQGMVQQLIAIHEMPYSDPRDYQLLHLSAALLHTVFAKVDSQPVRRLPEALLQVLALIARVPNADLSNQNLANRARMSLERFIRSFREHLGQTPAAYVTSVRVKAASELLALSDKSIEQIALECGFPNRHYLSRVFARALGCGPAEFRKRQGVRKGI
ncbi:MAG: helix-turn-helix transcriptional regulator [Verrucomicrobiaceae bacterium]|nr:helix-turn-helix transcriptional regulator [Verrucomicrobiaceae bacterium]